MFFSSKKKSEFIDKCLNCKSKLLKAVSISRKPVLDDKHICTAEVKCEKCGSTFRDLKLKGK